MEQTTPQQQDQQQQVSAEPQGNAQLQQQADAEYKANTQQQQSPPVMMLYGGWRTKKGSDVYTQADKLGYVLCKNGYVVRSGGQEGVMDAVTEGAARANSELAPHERRDIEGITLQRFYGYFCPLLTKVNDFRDIGKRTDAMAAGVSVHVVMPGGKGTMFELFYLLQFKISKCEESRSMKVYVFRDPWEFVLQDVYKHTAQYVGRIDEYRDVMTFVDHVDDILRDLNLL